jgi:hypothetical protein
MAAALTAQIAPHAGLTGITYAVGGGTLTTTGNTAPCGSGLGLLIKNGSGSPVTVTITVPAGITYDGLGIASATPGSGSRSVSVAAGADAIIPLVATTYADPTTGLATFGISAVTTVSAACIAISA